MTKCLRNWLTGDNIRLLGNRICFARDRSLLSGPRIVYSKNEKADDQCESDVEN